MLAAAVCAAAVRRFVPFCAAHLCSLAAHHLGPPASVHELLARRATVPCVGAMLGMQPARATARLPAMRACNQRRD